MWKNTDTKGHVCRVPFVRNVRTTEIHKERKYISNCHSLGGRSVRATTNAYRVIKMLWSQTRVMVAELWNYTKAHWIVYFKVLHFMVCDLNLNKHDIFLSGFRGLSFMFQRTSRNFPGNVFMDHAGIAWTNQHVWTAGCMKWRVAYKVKRKATGSRLRIFVHAVRRVWVQVSETARERRPFQQRQRESTVMLPRLARGCLILQWFFSWFIFRETCLPRRKYLLFWIHRNER